MNRLVAVLAGTALLLGASPVSAAPPGPDTGDWSSVVLVQTEEVPAMATGVAVGPSAMVAVGGRACERTPGDDIGACWGQPWVSADGVTWEAVEAHASGLDLGRFRAATSGPEVGIEGVGYGTGGFVAFGWAQSDRDSVVGTGPSGVTPALWRSDDGRSWERLPTPDSFTAEGPMLSGAWPQTIVGTDDGYLLGGTLYASPAPRAAIWSSPDGETWTLAGPDEAFAIGGYVDTMEMPAAGGVVAIAVAPQDSAGAASAIAVGEACPGPDEGVGPKGAWAAAFDWTPGDCAARLWRSEDGETWEMDRFRAAEGGSLHREPYWARTVATTGEQDTAGVEPPKVLVSADGSTWDVATGGPLGRHLALTAVDGRFYALLPECDAARCRRKGLALWSSEDGATWHRDVTQPPLPAEPQEFIDVDMAAAGDRLVVAASYFSAPYGELASMALVSPPLTGSAAGDPGATALPDASPAALVMLPPANAAPLPDTASLPTGSRIAYVRGADSDGATVHVIAPDGTSDVPVAPGNRPSWAPDGERLAFDCRPRKDAGFPGSICVADVDAGNSEAVLRRAWRPRWSPVDDSIAFSRSVVDLGDAWVRDLETGATTQLPGGDPEWAPAGDRALVREMFVGELTVAATAVRPDGSDRRILGSAWNATWSPDGRRVAATSCDDTACRVTATDVESGETETLFAIDAPIRGLRWLPADGLAMVVGSSTPELAGDLFVVELSDGSVRSLTSGLAVAPDLTVSPDGAWLAFSAVVDGDTDIYLASRDGGWAPVTTSGDATAPTWGP